MLRPYTAIQREVEHKDKKEKRKKHLTRLKLIRNRKLRLDTSAHVKIDGFAKKMFTSITKNLSLVLNLYEIFIMCGLERFKKIF